MAVGAAGVGALSVATNGVYGPGGLDTGSLSSAAMANTLTMANPSQAGPFFNTQRPSMFSQMRGMAGQVLKNPLLNKFMYGGAAGGSIAGGLFGAMAVRGGSLRQRVIGGALGAIAGGSYGAYRGYRAGTKVAQGLHMAEQEVLRTQRSVPDKRRFGSGPGYRTWARGRSGRISPGHLGADGSLPLAMSRARYSSQIK